MPDGLTDLRIALVYDGFAQLGGAERMFLAIKELFPKAAIYTSIATGEWVRRLGGRRPHASFMQKLPFKRKLERAYFPLYPLAFESFDFSGYDLVISSSSRFAHGIVTRPETKHICYMNSPGRMFWEAHQYFGAERAPHGSNRGGSRLKLGRLLSPVLSYLRLWDFAAAQRVDHFIANSKHIAGKIAKYYHREAKVVYPFVDLQRFSRQPVASSQQAKSDGGYFRSADAEGNKVLEPKAKGSYYLVVTRLVEWKRVDIAVKAANRARFRLKIVGDGPDRKRLEALVNGKWKMVNGEIELLGRVSDEELVELYRGCKAFIMTQKEDFGIAPLEAQAMGKPVIAFGAGGVLETVVEGKTGVFFKEQTSESLIKAIKRAEKIEWDPRRIRKNALRFGKDVFKEKFKAQVEKLMVVRR